MAETLIILAAGEERLIRVRCGAAAGELPNAAANPAIVANGAAAPEPAPGELPEPGPQEVPPGGLPDPGPQEPAQMPPAGANAQINPEGLGQNFIPQPGVPPNQGPPIIIPPNIPEYPMARKSRSTRKNRKQNEATRKNRKQSGGKRGMNPFMKFAAKERKNIMSSNPGMPVTEVGKELGKRWRALSEAQKKSY